MIVKNNKNNSVSDSCENMKSEACGHATAQEKEEQGIVIEMKAVGINYIQNNDGA